MEEKMTILKGRIKLLIFLLPFLMTTMCYVEPDPYCGDYGCDDGGGDYPVCRTTGSYCRDCGNAPIESCCDWDYTYCWYQVCHETFYCDGVECAQAAMDMAGFCSGAVCGDGVCEDGENSSNCPEDCTAVITLSITDKCLDGEAIAYKFYDETSLLVWPSLNSYYETPGLNIEDDNDLTCIVGNQICYGAENSIFYWGVGLDNQYDCDDCCIICEKDLVQGWSLYCD